MNKKKALFFMGNLIGPWKAAIEANGGTIENENYIESQYILYPSATFICIAGTYKVGKLMAQKPLDGTGDFEWTRGSIVNTTGLEANEAANGNKLRTLASNFPSIQNSPNPSALLEPQTTNFITGEPLVPIALGSILSEELDYFEAGFTRYLIQILAGQNSATITARFWGNISGYSVTAQRTSITFFMQYVDSPIFNLNITGAIAVSVWVNIQNGTVLSQTAAVDTCTMTAFNGGYLMELTTVAQTFNDTLQIRGALVASDGNTSTVNGDLYIGLLQLETQNTPTSPIATGATRVLDRVLGGASASVFSNTEGAFVIEMENFRTGTILVTDGANGNVNFFHRGSYIECTVEGISFDITPTDIYGKWVLTAVWNATTVKVYENENNTPLATATIPNAPQDLLEIKFVRANNNNGQNGQLTYHKALVYDSIASAESDLTWLTF